MSSRDSGVKFDLMKVDIFGEGGEVDMSVGSSDINTVATPMENGARSVLRHRCDENKLNVFVYVSMFQ